MSLEEDFLPNEDCSTISLSREGFVRRDHHLFLFDQTFFIRMIVNQNCPVDCHRDERRQTDDDYKVCCLFRERYISQSIVFVE